MGVTTMAKLNVGDNVAYSVQFLKSIGMSHSAMAQARGVITEIKRLSQYATLATIDWKNDYMNEIPNRVMIGNLAKVGLNRKFCNID
jgi:hypothetical protein